METVAAIDVGSNYVRMFIAQVTKQGEILPLEDLKHTIHIGKDSFAYGKIATESIHELCEHLKGFVQLMREYKIRHYRAVSTSGIREAQNKDYVLEQIRLKTGLEVEEINNAEERFLMYKGLREYLSSDQDLYEDGVLLLNITSGGVEISIYKERKLKFTEYIKIGSLRLREILSDLEKMTIDFPSVMEEFVKSKIDIVEHDIRKMKIKNFIGLGGELGTLFNICLGEMSQGERFIHGQQLENLHKKVRKMTAEQMIKEYGIPKSQAQILLPSVIIFKYFLEMTKAEGIHSPLVSLRHGLIVDLSDECFNTERKKEGLEDIIQSAWYIGKKYGMDEVHATYIQNIALSIFEQTRKIHRLGHRERLFLQVSCILHDVGKYVNLNEHNFYSSSIILSQGIMGFSNRELQMIANIVRYHSMENPSYSDESYRVLNDRDKIIVSKLAAILKLAEALDMSHKQKIKDLDITFNGENLYFKVQAKEEILLENWNFTYQAGFFEEVLGYRPVIKCKG